VNIQHSGKCCATSWGGTARHLRHQLPQVLVHPWCYEQCCNGLTRQGTSPLQSFLSTLLQPLMQRPCWRRSHAERRRPLGSCGVPSHPQCWFKLYLVRVLKQELSVLPHFTSRWCVLKGKEASRGNSTLRCVHGQEAVVGGVH
jgi:hypothetical protein